MKDLPYTISLPSHDALVVHAGLVPGKDLEEQTPLDMCTMRNLEARVVPIREQSEAVSPSYREGESFLKRPCNIKFSTQ